jgi:hypothetical protein
MTLTAAQKKQVKNIIGLIADGINPASFYLENKNIPEAVRNAVDAKISKPFAPVMTIVGEKVVVENADTRRFGIKVWFVGQDDFPVYNTNATNSNARTAAEYLATDIVKAHGMSFAKIKAAAQ